MSNIRIDRPVTAQLNLQQQTRALKLRVLLAQNQLKQRLILNPHPERPER